VKYSIFEIMKNMETKISILFWNSEFRRRKGGKGGYYIDGMAVAFW
jgi:hypothetical protein